jgi:hypothetical protein
VPWLNRPASVPFGSRGLCIEPTAAWSAEHAPDAVRVVASDDEVAVGGEVQQVDADARLRDPGEERCGTRPMLDGVEDHVRSSRMSKPASMERSARSLGV